MNETSKETYDFGKLKRFLTMSKLMMQDTLLTLTQSSCYNFVDVLESHVAREWDVSKAPTHVRNMFFEEEDYEYEEDRPKDPIELFAIDILKAPQGSEFDFFYSNEPSLFVKRPVEIFEAAIKKLQDIQKLEELILPHLFKTQGYDTYLKAAVIPINEPIPPNIEEKKKGKLPDENTWCWDLKMRLISIMERAVSPLEEFLKKFEKYTQLVKLQPEKYMHDFDCQDEDLKKSPEEIR